LRAPKCQWHGFSIYGIDNQIVRITEFDECRNIVQSWFLHNLIIPIERQIIKQYGIVSHGMLDGISREFSNLNGL